MFSGQFLTANDEAGVYPRSYYAATANILPPFPALEGSERADVCVIGGGYTGLSTALHLAERGYSVVLLEAHRVGWGASGRNGGQVGTGQRRDQESLEESLGKPHAHALWQIAEEAKALVRSLVETHAIDCDLKPGIVHADHKARYVDESRAYAEKLQSEYDYSSIRFIDRDEIRALLGTDAYHGGTYDTGSMHLHPLNYVLGLAHAAQKAGVRIFETSTVTRLEKTDPAVVHTADGSVSARFVVLACNGYLDDLDKSVARRVMPINNFIVATEPLDDELARSINRDDVAVADSRFVINYYRMSADKRLLFGGGENYSFRFPADIKAFVRKPMLEIYPQLKDIRLDYGWGGTLSITLNRLPYFTRLKPNILSAGGYSGQGVALASLAGQILAETIDGTASRFDVMERIPTPVFPGGASLRYPLLVLGMMYYALRDKL
ncbi:NAD(P)/FAD-dependent oxidoreductase [Coralliovum pocilloporae]|uniref:NAD(P)/FAD-dependent oxidoreductase n=1 Tax=Coralliovum pocilloporae TaxID=3066369 RepID=UPI003306F78C